MAAGMAATWLIAAKPDKKRACRPFGPLYPRTYESRRADLRSRCEKKGKTFEEEERHQAKRKKKNKKSLCTIVPGAYKKYAEGINYIKKGEKLCCGGKVFWLYWGSFWPPGSY